MFALVLQGFGITVVALLGILGCIAHLKLFTGLVRPPAYQQETMICGAEVMRQ